MGPLKPAAPPQRCRRCIQGGPSRPKNVLYSFTGGADGNSPWGVIADSVGNLYGTTNSGGSQGHGVIYKLDSTGKQTVLHTFTGGTDGSMPFAGMIRDSVGNLFGTTYAGGDHGFGVVLRWRRQASTSYCTALREAPMAATLSLVSPCLDDVGGLGSR